MYITSPLAFHHVTIDCVIGTPEVRKNLLERYTSRYLVYLRAFHELTIRNVLPGDTHFITDVEYIRGCIKTLL